MKWELHGSDGHFEIQDMDESRRVALIRFATLEEARCMTAAPDLLKALKFVVAHSTFAGLRGSPQLKVAKTAIAKAEIG